MAPKFTKTAPCKNCPYRRDAPLALWDRGHFQDLLDQDQEPFGKIYGCHKNDGHVCRGYLMDQDRRNIPNMNLRLQLIKQGITRVYLDRLASPSPTFESIPQMAEANFPGITNQSKENGSALCL